MFCRNSVLSGAVGVASPLSVVEINIPVAMPSIQSDLGFVQHFSIVTLMYRYFHTDTYKYKYAHTLKHTHPYMHKNAQKIHTSTYIHTKSLFPSLTRAIHFYMMKNIVLSDRGSSISRKSAGKSVKVYDAHLYE